MFEFLVGVKVGERYTALVKEEMGYDGDTRRYAWPTPVADVQKAANRCS